ncbi:MAG: DUF1062 domain-containing protein [Lachnospiraceae bacterium]|nr:DUF1062 domain-containing protein [Lachnospiraceae bacterium]
MSYLKTIEYRINPTQSFTIRRSCSGCGQKSRFKNTGKFRVNANGSKLDVWLIYQCEKCRHTFNLTIYERQKNTSIPAGEYQRFLDNDEQLAEEYGRNHQLFQKNKAEIDTKTRNYELIQLQETMDETVYDNRTLIAVQNPYHLKIRPEKLVSEILGLSSNQVKKLIAKETIAIQSTAQSVHISVSGIYV